MQQEMKLMIGSAHIEQKIEQEVYWVDPREVGHVNE